jgi:alginate O-acetyltransferase complex protein AlgI
MIIGISQVLTMALIGLWHGITPNFLLWGLWHGLGLFATNRWIAFSRNRNLVRPSSLVLQRVVRFVGILITFNYVTLGWVWFVMPTARMSLSTIAQMFGISS